jgi:hypothetical protein
VTTVPDATEVTSDPPAVIVNVVVVDAAVAHACGRPDARTALSKNAWTANRCRDFRRPEAPNSWRRQRECKLEKRDAWDIARGSSDLK